MWYFIKSYKLAVFGALTIALAILVAILAPIIAPSNPYEIQIQDKLCLPSVNHWLGCDHEGIDLVSSMMYGARVSLYVALVVIFFCLILGTAVGLVSGFYGGMLDMIVMRISDVFLAFPGILLAIAIAAMLGPSIHNTVIALSVTGWVGFSRLVRGEVLSLKEREFVKSAEAIGAPNGYIMIIYILPNILGPLIVHTTFSIAGVIIAESSLSFLGLGVPVGMPSWGKMLDNGRDFLFEAPRLSVVPGIAIVLIVLAFNFLGDALRDHFDPKVSVSPK